MGILGVLFLILLVLKLLGVISIGWFWVFSPLLAVPTVVGIAFILGYLG